MIVVDRDEIALKRNRSKISYQCNFKIKEPEDIKGMQRSRLDWPE
jgi:hypothetical protein